MKFREDPSASDGSGRSVRVFVSSTFSDLQAERDELAKRAFPALRRLCEDRGVTWTEIDLRWGINDELAAEGRVLPICLAEIDRSRPFFIGILGERYGWIPPSLDEALLPEYPWLADYSGKSITELEFLHGALREPLKSSEAFFYIRVRSPSAPAHDEHKLDALKARVRASGRRLREGFSSPQALSDMVLTDLGALIDRQYPPSSGPDRLQREAAEHTAFAHGRRFGYVARPEDLATLDRHAEGFGPPLVILGDAGVGKSSLLANWALTRSTGGKGGTSREPVVMHFVGASSASSDWTNLARRLLTELGRAFGLRIDVPDQPLALRGALRDALQSLPGRAVLVLDGMNQLQDRDQAPDLVWLPAVLPTNVRLVVSTLPGRPLQELTRRDWPTMTVGPLSPEERRRVLVAHLARYAKILSRKQADVVVAAPQAANPLFLRTLLEELRLQGDHRTLDQRIAHYLSAAGAPELFQLVLQRYEDDYNRERPGLVRDVMSLLWAARRGLSESELLDLLGDGQQALPSAYWSPLHLAAEQSLIVRSGMLGFAHEYMRRAIQHRYLMEPEDRRAAHSHLAAYFGSRERDRRAVEELPWQLAQAGAWQRLYELLADVQFLQSAWDVDEFDVYDHWSVLEQESQFRMADAYRPLAVAPAYQPGLSTVARILQFGGHTHEASRLWSRMVETSRMAGDRKGLAGALGNNGVILQGQGRYDEALALFREQEAICRKLNDLDGLQASLGHQGLVLLLTRQAEAALPLLKQQEDICRQLGRMDALQVSLGNQAMERWTQGDLKTALALLNEQERICRETGDRLSLSRALGNRGIILRDRGHASRALELFHEQERICRALGNQEGLAHAVGDQAIVLLERGDVQASLTLFRQEEDLGRVIGYAPVLKQALKYISMILRMIGDRDGAVAKLEELERLCRNSGDESDLQFALSELGLHLRAGGDLATALRLHREAEALCRALGDHHNLQRSLGNQAAALAAGADVDGALSLLKEQEAVCREHGNIGGLAHSLTNQSIVLARKGRRRAARAVAREAYRLAIEQGLDSLAKSCRAILHSGGRIPR